MNPRQLNLQIDVEERESVESGFGDGEPEKWKKIRTEWFHLHNQGGREFEQEQQVRSETTHVGRCHWFDGANSKMRLRRGDRIWHVQHVANENEQNRWLVWSLKEHV